MRKTCVLWLLCALACTGAGAQTLADKAIKSVGAAVGTPSELVDGGYYLMRNLGHGTYVKEREDGSLWLENHSASFDGSVADDDMNCVVKLVKSGDKWKIQFESGKYMPALLHGTGMSSCEEADAESFEILNHEENGSAVSGHFRIHGTQTTTWTDNSEVLDLNGNGPGTGTLTGWAASAKGGNGDYEVKPVTFYPYVVKYVYSVEGVSGTHTEKVGQDCGSAYALSVTPDFLKNCQFTAGTIPAEGEGVKEVQVSCTLGIPFTPTTISDGDFADGTHWYVVKARGNKIWNVNTTETTEGVALTSDLTLGADKKQYFCFVLDQTDFLNVKVYSMKDGVNKPLGYGSVSNSANLIFSETNAYDVFTLKKGNDDGSGFALKPAAGAAVANDLGQQGVLKLWASSTFSYTDAGSCMTVADADLSALATEIGNRMAEENSGLEDYVGGPVEHVNAAKTVASAYLDGREGDERGKVLVDLIEMETGEYPISLDVDACYQLISYADGKVAYALPIATSTGDRTYDVNGSERNILLGTESEVNPAAALWRFCTDVASTSYTRKEGAYFVRHVNSTMPLRAWGNTSDNQNVDLPINDSSAGGYEVVSSDYDNAVVAIRISSDAVVSYVASVDGELRNLNAGTPTASSCQWRIKKVASVPVTVGEVGWASVCLPVPVEIPGDGVTVYKATAATATDTEAGVVRLEQISAGTKVQAGTPMLVEASQGTYTFGICDASEATALDGNILSGATAKRTGLEANSYYGLGNKTAGVGFYLSSITTVPANKAYLLKNTTPSGASVLAYRFDTGGEATGVSGVTLGSEVPEAYYDLHGRRVLYPAKGIYVTSSGKKIFKN